MRRCVACGLGCVLLAVTAAAIAPASDFRTTGRLTSPWLTEISGIATSRRNPNVVWGVNDGGNRPSLHAFSATGDDLGFVRVRDVKNVDWEDLAAFVLDDVPYLLIADTGDNSAERTTSTLLIVEEPHAGADGRFSGAVDTTAQLRFSFPGGPRDCEAVGVDVALGRILLVSKREVPAVVYELPLTLTSTTQPLLAKQIATIATLPRPTVRDIFESPFLGAYKHQPTGLDIAADGSVVALLTYQNLYLYPLAADQQWARDPLGKPRVLPLPRLNQAESVAFFPGGVITVSEGRSAPLLSFGPITGKR